MGYIGKIPSAVPLTSADITDGIITSAKIANDAVVTGKIADGTIVNADINASAGVVFTKLASTGTLTVDNIQFPATAVASANANNLDDYEEGTWTPTLGGNTTYTGRYGRYIKVGQLVSIQFGIVVGTLGTGSTQLVSGLPFTSENIGALYAQQTGCVSYYGSLAVNTIFLAFYVQNNNTNFYFVGKSASGATVDNAPAIFGNNTEVYGSVTYKAST